MFIHQRQSANVVQIVADPVDDFLHPIKPRDPSLDRMAVPRTIMYRYSRDLVIGSMEKRLARSGGAPGS